MSDQKKQKLTPMRVKIRDDVRRRLQKIAAVNGLSLQDVVNLSASAGSEIVENKLKEMQQQPQPA